MADDARTFRSSLGFDAPAFASKGAGTAPAKAAIAKRMDFLWRSAHAIAKADAATAHAQVKLMCDLGLGSGLVIPEEVVKLVCPSCCALSVPGWSCRVRVHHRAKASKAAKRRRSQACERNHALRNELVRP